MTTQALALPRYRRGEQIYLERVRNQTTERLKAVDDAITEWCEEFPGLVWEEFCRDGGLAL